MDPQLKKWLIEISKKYPHIQKLILFGSRARGDNTERSDYDIAVLAPQMSDGDWAAFSVYVKDNIPSLCGVDLVNLQSKLDQKFKKRIYDEGSVIYEKESLDKN